jgi:hypothetical protein
MSEKAPDTLFELLDAYDVEVPIIQRDYAQGRQDDHAKMVRENILKDIKRAVLRETPQTPPLDLSFVYGKAESKAGKEKFIPIDGQQRLTTLFLLYLYAFRDDESKTEIFNKFTYKTRVSSRVFLEKLTQKRSSVFVSKLSPSEEIEDSEWFVSGWENDPTIKSVLTMLDDIKAVFNDVENLAQYLSTDNEYKPVTFKFLEMEDLGMEDSLYIKLNARGKPLTALENFKARLIGRLKELNPDFADKFENSLDVKWTDIFWSRYNESFDLSYLTFFGVLLMNKGKCSEDNNWPESLEWSNSLDYEKIDAEIFQTIFLTLNFLTDNHERKEEACQLVFNAVTEDRTYKDRLLFHAVTAYIYMAKGVDTGSLKQWIRIIKNLTLNSQIDKYDSYREIIVEINRLTDNWNSLLDYFAKSGKVDHFAQKQIEEERKKAQIIFQSQNSDFANAIYEAEKHPYFSGQIRSALYYAISGKPDIKIFNKYWAKISALFDDSKPKHGDLLRRALLTFGDYTLKVSDYKTLCVDDPKEGESTPSMKRLFSDQNEIVKQLLDTLNSTDPMEEQLKRIVDNSTVPKNDWKYCFINFPDLFSSDWMSKSHLRLREVDGEFIIVRNKSSSGYNYEVFLSALYDLLNQKGLESDFGGGLGANADRYLFIEPFYVRFKNGQFTIKDATNAEVFVTSTEDPLGEVSDFILTTLKACNPMLTQQS